MQPEDFHFRSFLDIAVLTREERCPMDGANSQQGLVDYVQAVRHLRDLVPPEGDVIISEESDYCCSNEVMIERQLLLSPIFVAP